MGHSSGAGLHQAAGNPNVPAMNKILRAILLSLALAVLQPLSILAHSAIEPLPRNDGWWQERHKLLNQRAADAAAKSQLIFIGDSITQGWEGEGKDTWTRFYAPRNAVNLGISGDRTQHVLWRLENGNIDSIKPKAAVVMIGTNNSNGDDNTPGQIADGITAIVQKLRDALPDTKVLLLAIFPRSENFSAQRGKILQANQVLQKLADNKHVFFVDFGHRFLNSDGLIPAALMPDYLHLSRRGYELWAESLESHISEVLGDKR
jgi:lysophospholipase L1-like esterase